MLTDGLFYDQAIETIIGGDPQFEYDNAGVNTYFADEPNVVITGEGDDIEVVVIALATNPVAAFDVNIPVNQNKTTVNGWEVTLRHTLGDTSFQARLLIAGVMSIYSREEKTQGLSKSTINWMPMSVMK